MDLVKQQARIDAIPWYHEFDFGNGLKARSRSDYADGHRRIWKFLEDQLDTIDFRGKSVLDIGCWDGYWSFYAERRGAQSVLATDDVSQNWSDGDGLRLAKELYDSKVEVNQQLSIYQLPSIQRKFDVILCLGVYYHLFAPFYALSQVRHCCHADTIVVFEGEVAPWSPASLVQFNFRYRGCEMLPTQEAMRDLLQANYFSICSEKLLETAEEREQVQRKKDRLGWRWRLRMCLQALKGSRLGVNAEAKVIAPLGGSSTRTVVICKPFEGVNDIHSYPPPFGLDVYDSRFQQVRSAA